MLIVCPNCATSYRVEPASLGGAGRSVRCVRCRSVWFAHDPSALDAVADGYRSEALAVAGQAAAAEQSALAPDTVPAAAPETTAPPEAPDQNSAALETAADEQALAGQDMRPATLEPVAMADAPAVIEHDPLAPLADATVGEDIETVAARRAKREARRRFQLPAPGLPATIMALIAISAILIGWRGDVVKVLPQTASFYAAVGLPVNLRGLNFADVTTTTEAQDGVSVLVVEGSIVSAGRQVVEVPRLRFAVRNPKGQEIYSWTALPTRSVLAPGETLAFRSRLASPPPEGRAIDVRFFNKRDIASGGA